MNVNSKKSVLTWDRGYRATSTTTRDESTSTSSHGHQTFLPLATSLRMIVSPLSFNLLEVRSFFEAAIRLPLFRSRPNCRIRVEFSSSRKKPHVARYGRPLAALGRTDSALLLGDSNGTIIICSAFIDGCALGDQQTCFASVVLHSSLYHYSCHLLSMRFPGFNTGELWYCSCFWTNIYCTDGSMYIYL